MGDLIIKGIQNTPIPTMLIVVGLLILVLAFVTKIGGMIEVSPEQRRWAIPTGLFVLVIGLSLNFASPIGVQPPPQSSTLTPVQNPQSTSIGWIYVGKAKPGDDVLEDRRIRSSQIPLKNTPVETAQNVTLRESAGKSAREKRTLASNTKLKVEDIKRLRIPGQNYDAVWVQVSESSTN